MRFVSILILVSFSLFAGCKKSSYEDDDVNDIAAQENFIHMLDDLNSPVYDHFPAGIFDANEGYDKFVNRWYGSHLTALGEPSLYTQRDDASKRIYRFTWLRTFHRPISVRLEI